MEILNLVELLTLRASQNLFAQPLYTFLEDGEQEASCLTTAELDSLARGIGNCLQDLDAAGGRCLLLYPPGLDFIAAFFGALYAGAVAVPAYPPSGSRSLPRLRSVALDARPRWILTTTALEERVRSWMAETPEMGGPEVVVTDRPADSADGWRAPEIRPESVAFLQYTSGSTASPKGVMVSHANVLHNQQLIRTAFRQEGSRTVVGWLPPYHDMGLIGNILQPLYSGGRAILMSPVAFLQRPVRWLEAIGRYRAHTSGGPDFAYALCVDRTDPAERAALDLRSWQVAFNGAEPVRATTLERFARAFAASGFRREAFFPCYGLAEATLLVTARRPSTGPLTRRLSAAALEREGRAEPATEERNERALVSSGSPPEELRVAVVDPETASPRRSAEVGEIWVAGASVAGGYWRRERETAESFGARLASGEGPFLRTGDLGFMADGELFVTGRLKDLIILRGRNLYPQDVELTVEGAHPALRPGCGAAFSVDDGGEERLVVAQELRRRWLRKADAETIGREVRRAVAEEHEAQLHELVLIRTGSMPKTTSGKIQRRECRRRYLEGELTVVGRSGAGAAAECGAVGDFTGLDHGQPAAVDVGTPDLRRWLTRVAASTLRRDATELDSAQPLTAYGLDSLAAVELSHAVESRLGAPLPLSDLLAGCSLDELATAMTAGMGETAALGKTTRERATGATGAPPPATFPLSWGQRGLWFLSQVEGADAAYRIVVMARAVGELDVAALERAFAELAARHPALRTRFEETPDGPRQRVDDGPGVEFLLRDAAAWDRRELRRRSLEAARRPFDLGRGPLFRVALFRLGPSEHRAVLVVHHLIADFWSLAVLLRELRILYRRQLGGAVPEPPLPAASYADFVDAQRRRLEGEGGDRLWEYWRRRLSGAPELLELPIDRPRPPVQSYRGASEEVALGSELADRLGALAAARGASLYTLLLAGFGGLLHRHGAGEDLPIGTPVVLRRNAALAGVVGYLVHPLVMRTDLSGDPSFERLLERVRASVVADLEHREYPFPLLVERLAVARDPGRAPLFQVMFVFQAAPPSAPEGLAELALGTGGGRIELEGATLESVRHQPVATELDLTLQMAQTADGQRAVLVYNPDLFDRSTIRRLLDHLRRLLASIVEAPDRPLSELPILGRAERHQLLREWAETAPLEAAPAATIHGLVDAAAGRRPDAVAVVDADGATSYRQLRDRARSLARRLRHLGVRAEDPVAVLARRSRHLPVALLAVLEAGASYLPLDPAYPPERLAFLLDDARATALLADGTDPPQAARHLPTLDLRDDAPTPEDRPLPPVDPGQLAYLIYTSGSTGRPKGVAIEHRSAAARLRWAARAFGPEELRAVLAATSVCFDLSVFELFAPLAAGGTVFLADDALDFPHRDFAHRVRLVNTVPSAIAELLRHDDLPDAVRTVNLAGEPLPAPLVEELYRRPGVRRVLNLYGPSEDTTYSTGARTQAGETPPIGRPLPGTAARVLDPRLRPLPTPVAGELHLGGAGLARGYLRRPARTAERFVPDPFAATPGARLYRTGDRVRQRADGTLEFLGRRDHQVKVRGFRIELGEVEAALDALEPVREAAVAVSADGGALVAYLVPAPGADPAGLPERCRRRLGERLPAYLVPAVYTVLERLPRTPNGKLDRAALPVATATVTATTGSAPPATPLGELVAGVWAEVLPAAGDAARRLGWDDDFFALGGHSLLATRVVARLRHLLGVEVPVRRLFERPTLRGFTELVAAARRRDSANPLPPIEPGSGGELAPLSYPQERLWFLDQLQPGEAAYVIAAALELRGPLRADWLLDALHRIVDRHAALRTTFEVDGELPRQRVHRRQPPSVARVDLAALPTAERRRQARRLARAEARRPFDLGRGPLVRLRLLRLAGDEHLAVLALHHVVADGWSLGVLLGELSELYTARAEGRPPALPPLPVQYPDFARWQRRQLRGELLEKLTDYWRRALAETPATLELPTDRPRPPVQSLRGERLPVTVPEPFTEALRALGTGSGATLFMVLLAGFATLLHRYTGQLGFRIGTPVAHRDRVEVEGLVGCFVNLLALPVDLTGDPPFRALLPAVRESTLGGYDHQGLPFEKLVEMTRSERDLSRPPLCQAVLALHTVPLPAGRLPGLESRRVEIDNGTAKFDLTLELTPAGGGLDGWLELSSTLFDRVTARRLAEHYRHLLAAAVAAPGSRLSELPFLADAERHQMLLEWNDTGVAEPTAVPVHQLFARRARHAPDRLAIADGWLHLSYGELDRRAGLLARRLRGWGVGPEVMVGLHLDRSALLVIAALAVLEAGGAYVPLDPDSPARRLAAMASDLRPPVVLTRRGLHAALPEALAGADLRVVELDTAVAGVVDGDGGTGEAPDGHPAEGGTRRPAGLGHLAYVIFTSGSTGRPKGVAVEHRGLANLVRWHRRIHGLGAGDRGTLLAAPGFDASVWEIWPHLAAGAALTVVPEAARSDPEALPSWLAAERITTCFLPTPLAEEVLARPLPPGLVLRRLLTGGDRLRRPPAVQPPFTYCNHYGPTESSVVTTWAPVAGGGDGPPAIGRPIDGLRVHLLDRRLRPAPRGAAAELCIGGIGLARGYLGRPATTARAFVPDPTGGGSGERLYRSGDLARLRADGAIEFLGRRDHQVKLRGFRIELGEIEHAVGEHPAVEQSAVVLHRADGGRKRLVGFFVAARNGGDFEGGELRDFLRARLPDYMVPAFWVRLDELPKSAHGKIDRRRLVVPGEAETESAERVPPRTPLERRLAEIWCRELGCREVGMYDDFFALGGHSLLATRLVARYREELGVELSLRQLFENPTLAGLAKKIEEGGPGGETTPEAEPFTPPAIRAIPRRRYRRGGGDDTDVG